MLKIPILTAMLLALTLTPIVSSADGNKTVIDAYQEIIQNADAEYKKLKRLTAEAERKVAELKQLMDAIGISKDGKNVTLSIDGNEILEISRTALTRSDHKGIYQRSLKLLGPNNDAQELGRTSLYDSLVLQGSNRHASMGIGPNLSFHSVFPDSNDNRHFYLALGDTWNNNGVSKDDFIIHSWNNSYKNHVQHMIFKPNGNVGIGINPQYKLDVKGQIRADNVAISSDERFKQNIHTLGSSLSKIAKLRGVHFNWKDNPEDKQIGLVAQEVEKVFPELVSTDSEGYKSIAYGKLTAVLIEAIKELQQQHCQH